MSMRRSRRVFRFFAMVLLLIAVISTSAQEPSNAPSSRAEREAAGNARRETAGADFEKQGIAVGQQVPDLEVMTLDGAPIRLSKLWEEKPTLLVTASLTCGRARTRQPWVNEVAAKYGDRLNVAVLYTVEAHPIDDPSPYAEYSPELENPDRPGERPGGNRSEEGFPRRQPTDLGGRQGLAREYRDLFDFEGPIVIDAMNNEGWEALGAGPNMGILIDRDGKVVEKQGWLHDRKMERALSVFFAEQN